MKLVACDDSLPEASIVRGLFPCSQPAIACSGIECYPYRLIFKGVIVAVHLLIVDALNLSRR
ncbi:hypothetical protein MZH70_26880, partial [Escherichia coli]|nr:hypothetical protein [Escherichia coli]